MKCLFFAGALALLAASAYADLPEGLAAALEREAVERDVETVRLRVGSPAASIIIELAPGASQESERVPARLLEPASEDALSEDQAELWRSWNPANRQDEEVDDAEEEREGRVGSRFGFGGYDRDAVAEAIGLEAIFDREEGGYRIYRFQPTTVLGMSSEGAMGGAAERMRGEAAVHPNHGHIAWIRYELLESFKPNAAARVREMEVTTRFVHDEALDGPRMSATEFRIKASAMFMTVDEAFAIEVLQVDYAPEDVSGGFDERAESP